MQIENHLILCARFIRPVYLKLLRLIVRDLNSAILFAAGKIHQRRTTPNQRKNQNKKHAWPMEKAGACLRKHVAI